MRKLARSFALVVVAAAGSTAAAQPGATQPVPPPGDPSAMPEPPPMPMPPQGQPMPPQGQPMQPMQPMQPQPMPPQATRATFVSTGETRFDVRVDGNAACTTPCALVIAPLRYVTLYSQERSPSKLSVGYMPPGDVLVSAKPRATGAFATGVTFTTLAGMGVATGISLTAVGC